MGEYFNYIKYQNRDIEIEEMVTKDLKDYIEHTDFGSEKDVSYATFYVRRSMLT